MEHEINSYNISANEQQTSTDINDNLFSNIDFGPLKQYLDDDNITDISYSNNGQVWLKSLDKGVYRVDNPGIDNDLMEKIAFQCANIMGKVFNMASPFLDSESAELRMNFVHDSIARNGIAAVFRKTPAKIRLQKDKLLKEKYITAGIHDFLIKCVKGHCNIMVAGETGSGKTELVKYLASHTNENEKIITIEDTLELHLDRIFPHRDIVAMKTNNIASYSDVLVTCMRQNPKWILLSEVRSAEAVTAVRNSISSGHNVLSTIHADKAQSIPHRMYSLLESNIDVEQFMTTIYRYIQLGIYVRARYDKERGFMREVAEVTEFYVNAENKPEYNVIYHKNVDGTEQMNDPSKYLIEYLANQGVDLNDESLVSEELPSLDEIDKQLKEKEARTQEKIEKKKEEAYYANFGNENYVEEEEKVAKPEVTPTIDLSQLSQPTVTVEVKEEESVVPEEPPVQVEEIPSVPEQVVAPAVPETPVPVPPSLEEKISTPQVEITNDDINGFIAAMQSVKEGQVAPATPVPVSMNPQPVEGVYGGYAEPTNQVVPEVPPVQLENIPAVPEVPVAPVVQPTIPEVPAQVTPVIPSTPVVPETPVVPAVPQIPVVPETPGPEVPNQVAPVVPTVPETPVLPDASIIPEAPPVVPTAEQNLADYVQEMPINNPTPIPDMSTSVPQIIQIGVPNIEQSNAMPNNPLDIEKTQYLEPVENKNGEV